MTTQTNTTSTQTINKFNALPAHVQAVLKGTGNGRGGFTHAIITETDGIALSLVSYFKNGDSDTYTRKADLSGWDKAGAVNTGAKVARAPRAVSVEAQPTTLEAEFAAMQENCPTASKLLGLMRAASVDLDHVNSNRSCSRCGHSLSDPASVLRGIGPECNAKATKILATEIPTAWENNSDVCFNFMCLTAEGMGLPEKAAPVFQAVYERIAASPEYSGSKNKNLGGDWRAEVKALTWLASFDIADAAVQTIFQLIDALGYAGYAAYVRGDASGGKSRVAFIEGRLHFYGPRNKEGKYAIKAIRGWQFHPGENGAEASWSVPAAKGDLFIKVIGTFWPLSDNRQGALTQAKNWAAENPAEAEKVEVVRLTTVGRELQIRSPYSADFVEGLKALIPNKNRSFGRDADRTAVWTVDARYLGTIKSLVATHYSGLSVVEKAA